MNERFSPANTLNRSKQRERRQELLGLTLLALVWVSGCTSAPQTVGPPMPPARPAGAVVAAGVTSKVQGTPVVPWAYPPGIDARQYCWEVETSTNLVDWYPDTNATWVVNKWFPSCATGTVESKANGSRPRFWRLKGTRF